MGQSLPKILKEISAHPKWLTMYLSALALIGINTECFYKADCLAELDGCLLPVYYQSLVGSSLTYYRFLLTNRLHIGCTPLINRVRRHLASQCFEIDNLDASPCLSKCQKNVENGVDALVFYVRCALLLAFSTSWHRKSNIS